MRRKSFRAVLTIVVALGALLGGGWWQLQRALAPVDANAKETYFRVEDGDTLMTVLIRAEKQGLIRSATAVRLWSRLTGQSGTLSKGTFSVSASMSGNEFLQKLLSGRLVGQRVLVREGLWITRLAKLLDSKGIDKAENVIREASKAEPLLAYVQDSPARTLEGYLFPDTYDFPPLLGAKETIGKMLEAFNRKVFEPLGRPKGDVLHKWVIIGSMVELEAAVPQDRRRIAGVIYNRLRIGMPLQIDATVAYAKGVWAPVTVRDYRLDHPYNTYRIRGLPPGPICSPGLDSIKAAANPEEHQFLYYVAMPDKTHLFSRTYDEHLRNISKSRKAFSEAGAR